MPKTKSSRPNNNPSADDNNDNTIDPFHSPYDKWLKSFYEDMGWKPVFYNWNKPTSTNTTKTTTNTFYKLLKQSAKAIERAEKLVNKINSSQTLASIIDICC
jgi:hypothetical protein